MLSAISVAARIVSACSCAAVEATAAASGKGSRLKSLRNDGDSNGNPWWNLPMGGVMSQDNWVAIGTGTFFVTFLGPVLFLRCGDFKV